MYWRDDNVEMTTVEVLSRGMQCLVENMGLVEAERFIATVMREKFDYTKWQRDYFDKKSPEELHSEAVRYAKEHPYQGKAKSVL